MLALDDKIKILGLWAGAAIPPSPAQITLLYIPVLGQSQAGGYNASPALTTAGDADCKTLTNGPLDVNVAGNFITCVEGDTFSDTGGPAATPNIETVATSMLQQLKAYLSGDGTIMNPQNYRYACTIHAAGGRTIQALAKGGASGQYEELIAATARVKALADANGWALQIYPLFFHGGDGDNVGGTYQSKVQQLWTDLSTDLNVYQEITNLYCIQQRIIGSPDYGTQIYLASKANTAIKIASPQYPVKEQGDGVHLINYAERHMGLFMARAVYRDIQTVGNFQALDLDIANAVFTPATMELRIPVLNGRFGGSGLQVLANGDISVVSNTTAQTISSLLVSGETTDDTHAKLVIQFPTSVIGTHSLTIKSAVTSTMAGGYSNPNIRDSSNDFDPTAFVDDTAAPYIMDKFLVRGTWDITVSFPVNALFNFGGSVADPAVANTVSIWDNTRSFVNVEYPVQGNVKVTALNDAVNFWGFNATPVKGGNQTLTGTNYYANGVLANYWFIEAKSAGIKLSGLNPAKLYTIRCAGLRTGTAGDRKTSYTIGGTTITKQSNRSGTAAVYTTDAENAVFASISPNGSGEITITMTFAGTDGTNFAYLNSLQITEQ